MNTVLNKLEDIGKLRTAIKELENSVQFISNQYETMEAKVKAQESTIKKLEKDAEEKNKIISDLEMRMVHSEQYARNRNFEVINVQQTPGENLLQIIETLAEELGVDYEHGDVDVVHRVPTRSRDAPPKIIVQLQNRTLHEKWMSKRQQGVSPTRIVANSTVTKNVRIFQHLSDHWRILLWEAKKKGTPLGYKVVWFKDNRILAKKSYDDNNVKVLYTLNDLSKLN